MAQEKVHGGMEAGINLDEDNHAQIPSHRGYVNGQKQHKKRESDIPGNWSVQGE